MKTLHYYYNKKKISFYLIICLVFVAGGIFVLNEKIHKIGYNIFTLMMLLSLVFFFPSAVFLFFVLIYRKPVLSVTDKEIIIYHFPSKRISRVPFSEIQSFYLYEYKIRNKTHRQILIQLKKIDNKDIQTKTYRFISRFFGSQVANSKYTIQAENLNINYKELLEELNSRLIKNQETSSHQTISFSHKP